MVATTLDASERRAIGPDPIHPCFEKRLPIVRCGVVKRFGKTLKCIWLHLSRTARGAKNATAKVTERFLAVRLFANRGVRFEPNEHSLIVEIHSTSYRFPIASSVV